MQQLVHRCCNSPATLLASLSQVEEVCDRGRVIPQILWCELRRIALTVEQMSLPTPWEGCCEPRLWRACTRSRPS